MEKLPPDLSLFWAKLSRGKATPRSYHPLLCHLLDVAAMAEALWTRALSPAQRRRVAAGLGVDEASAGQWITFWAALHDAGKLSPAFQGQDQEAAKPVAAAGFPLHPAPGVAPHGTVSALALEELLPGCGLSRMMAVRVGAVLGGHHGVFPRAADVQSLRGSRAAGRGRWIDARAALVKILADLLAPPEGNPPGLMDNATAMVVAGLVSVADWIGSAENLFAYLGEVGRPSPEVDLAAYQMAAAKKAMEALERVGWIRSADPPTLRSFRDLFPKLAEPNSLQREAIALADRLAGPCLVVVEAPMGDGKTEAAVYMADRWAALEGRHGLYFALPTQATSNQMFGRVMQYLERRYPGQPVELQLLHGHASLSAEFALLRSNAERRLDIGEIHGEPGHDGATPAVVASEWFTYRKRGLLAPFGVGTVDQALLAVLQTRHVFVRLFGLAGKTVIVDEVHAYDAYMTELMERLLEWLASLDCSVVLLSATLPESRRRQLLGAYARGLGDAAPASSDARYPRISWVSRASSDAREVEASPRARKEVRLEWVDGDLPAEEGGEFELGRQLRQAVAVGGCAAVICNTVARAQQVYLALKPYFPGDADDGWPQLDLLHARYLFEDREAREKRTLVRFGKMGTEVRMPDGTVRRVHRPDRAVLVSTQLIEQSLDIDLDLMVSDLAPVDLVLQRVGRLQRHREHDALRPARMRDSPILWLLKPEEREDGPVFSGGQTRVYDEHVLLRSWLVLRDLPALRVPGEVEKLIEEVYGDRDIPLDISAELRTRWGETLRRHREEMEAEAREAQERWLKAPAYSGALWRLTADPREEDAPDFHPAHQALTRLAEPSVSVVAVRESDGCLCLDRDGHQRLDPSLVPTPMQAEMLLRRSVSISDRRVVWDLLGQQAPSSWQRCPLVRHHRLVVLGTEGYSIVGRHRVSVDADLGVVVTNL